MDQGRQTGSEDEAAERRLALPQRIEKWSLTSLQEGLVKTYGRLVKPARYYWLLLAESHLTRRLFVALVRRIDALPLRLDRERRIASK